MGDPLITAAVTVVLVVIVWKLFTGMIKTLALLAILVAAAVLVFA